MNICLWNSVNSLILYNMEIMIKISFETTLMLTATIIINFDCFQMSRQMQKAMSQFIQATYISEKKFQKLHNLQDKTGRQKYKVSVTAAAKLRPAHFSILISKKFKNLLKTWLFPFLGHFLHTLRIRLSTCFFVYMSCIEKKNTNVTSIFIIQSRGLIGQDHYRLDHNLTL